MVNIILLTLVVVFMSGCDEEEEDNVVITYDFGYMEEDNVVTTYDLSYMIVDTNQFEYYSDVSIISEPSIFDAFYGQDANYAGNLAYYTNNNDGTVSDNVTGLMWQKTMDEKMSYEDAIIYANESTLGGYDDWRFPTIKELYSLIQFDGMVRGESTIDLFIDDEYFDQPIGDTSIGEREIDAQTWSYTEYVGETMNGDATVFGVNFIDGRIKGYPEYNKGTNTANTMYIRLVRGNEEYGTNNYIDNNDWTITDLATGLTWQQDDSGVGMNWEDSLYYCEYLELATYSDWRLPNAKELQSIVDYTKSPQTTNSPAIDDLFSVSIIFDMKGEINYPYFWSSTTHLDGVNPYDSAVYIAFGEASGIMNEILMDVHGAGAQRSDPKSGLFLDYPDSFGPQGDIRYVYNYVRCVRNTEPLQAGDNDSDGG